MDITREELVDVLQSIPARAQVLVCGHTRPDGDSMGSVLALVAALRLRDIDARPLLADNATPPAPYLWMAGVDDFTTPEELAQDYQADFFIALDTPDPKRMAEALPLLQEATQSLIIDHHPPLPESYADLRFADITSAATGELVWSLLCQLGWQLNADIATACYVATLSDTGSFQFSNTTKTTFAHVSEMIDAGAVPADAALKLYSQKPLAALHLEGRVLSRAKLLNGGAVIHSYLSDADLHEFGVPIDYTENLIDLIRSVRDTDAAVFITESSKGPRVSLRSDGRFDVSAAARAFGGGGHRPAAGITWPDKAASIEQILDALLPHLPHFATDSADLEAQETDREWKLVEADEDASDQTLII
ncbi:MAG: DHH family phosphoesterase [Coriobacteriia bacterium]|nr:DHH family phosphoesterase [Coriobacteriia bacterium]MCL2536914.1 DHH family phosphoesterase [Coriobacteriia bacterium]